VILEPSIANSSRCAVGRPFGADRSDEHWDRSAAHTIQLAVKSSKYEDEQVEVISVLAVPTVRRRAKRLTVIYLANRS
jgi:hypothetical protein